MSARGIIARRSVLAALLLAGAPAAAQTDAFQQAVAAFQARDYPTALRRFQRSYALSHSPELLFNIGLTYERMGRTDEAVATLQQFIALQPTSPQRADAERRIAALRPPPTPTPVVVAPTPVTPVLVVVAAPLPPAVVAPVPRPAARSPWPWIVLATGAAAGVAGAVAFGLASDPGGDPAVLTETQYLTAVDATHGQRVAGAVLLGVGGAAAVAGVIGLVTRRPVDERAALRVYGAPVAGGALVGVTLRAF